MPESWIPLPYQKRGVQWLLQHSVAGLFWDPGMRKTSTVLKALDVLFKAKLARRALVIPPLRVAQETWPEEIERWNEFQHLRWTLLHGGQKERELECDADIFLLNPDGLEWLMQNGRFRRLEVDTLVIDESTLFRHTNTQRFKLLKAVLPSFQRRWILTGTPTPKSYLDLFGQIYILDLGRALGQYISHYKMNYFFPTGPKEWGGAPWVLQEGAERTIQKLIKPYIHRLDAADYLKMPKLQPNIIRVTLPEAARTIYDDLEEEMFARLDETDITAANAAVASMKCCQVANGGIYYVRNNEMRRRTAFLHDVKLQALQELREELQGAPMLLCYEYEHDLSALRSVLGKDMPFIGGGTTEKELTRIKKEWNAGSIPVLPVHPRSAAHGLNMQYGGCAHVCFYNIPWDYELYDQLIRRVRRQGNTAKTVIAHHIVARNTVDEAKLRSLRGKEHNQTALLDALRTYRRAK